MRIASCLITAVTAVTAVAACAAEVAAATCFPTEATDEILLCMLRNSKFTISTQTHEYYLLLHRSNIAE